MISKPAAAWAQRSEADVQQYIERTAELLQWARDLVVETESGPARRVLRRAADLHQRSLNLLARGRVVEAMAVARRARDGMWHAVRVAREAMGLDERLRIRVERFREQYLRLVERAHEANDRRAEDFLDRARQQAERARDLYRQGDLKLAWSLFEQAGDLMHRAARLLADGAGPDRLQHDLERTRDFLDNARERLDDAATGQQMELLSRAETALQRAETAASAGQPVRALELLDLAGNLGRRLLRTAAGRTDDEAARRQLERFDTSAAQLADAVRESASAPAKKMLKRALAQRDRAVSTAERGEMDLALRQLRAAHDLLRQTKELLRR